MGGMQLRVQTLVLPNNVPGPPRAASSQHVAQNYQFLVVFEGCSTVASSNILGLLLPLLPTSAVFSSFIEQSLFGFNLGSRVGFFRPLQPQPISHARKRPLELQPRASTY
ncbi:unnamed protein product [Effrenium voratum]|uniref:Uncharacterized protein n=1 Tax=Effrenium voratum TaxID=2562239 RepID=A0AA36N917_9DINO|nr:unnamed protein product [Effrenium voratum]CAJ1444022.1 unnamed protein product [Effrenium voratum]CAJ1445795.1 unnamed protein product [Effrenium voratum]